MTNKTLIGILEKKGYSANIISSFEKVSRKDFVAEHLIPYADDDIALPNEEDSTISQPSTIAFMLELLDIKKESKILEIGSGSGYVIALLSELSDSEIYGIEIKLSLAAKAAGYFSKSRRIKIIHGNGYQGFEKKAPFDRIILSAAAPDSATIYNLISQLNKDGIIVAPVKDTIIRIKKTDSIVEKQEFSGFQFVKLRTE